MMAHVTVGDIPTLFVVGFVIAVVLIVRAALRSIK